MGLTMPQLIMLNHAGWVTSERMKRRLDTGRDSKEVRSTGPDVSKMNSAQQKMYYHNAGFI